MRIMAVDIGGTSIKLGISDQHGNLEQYREIDAEAKQGGSHLINRVINEIAKNYREFDRIGMSTAGQVNSETGSILYANENIPNYTGMNVVDIMEKRFNVATKIENDVNAAALGELYFGSGKDYRDFLCLTYGTGIGGAIIMDAALHKGDNGNAGEFGHIMTHPKGKICACGNAGCYEMYASTTALVNRAKTVDPAYTNGRIIFKGIEKGDIRLEHILHEWIEEVAYGLVSLIHVFNPPAVIIGGGVMERNKLVHLVEQKVHELIMESFANVHILKASLGNKAGLLGAVSLHRSSTNKKE